MIHTIDLYSRYQAAFGFIPQLKDVIMPVNLSVYQRGDATFADIVLTSSNNKKYVFKTGETIGGEQIIAPPPMVSFAREKHINKTIIDNSDYEVIEDFGLQSWAISWDGILVDMKNHWYPQEFLKKVNEMFSFQGIMEVNSVLFYDLGINSIYFQSISDLQFVEGYNDTIKYKLQAYSVKPTEFQLL